MLTNILEMSKEGAENSRVGGREMKSEVRHTHEPFVKESTEFESGTSERREDTTFCAIFQYSSFL